MRTGAAHAPAGRVGHRHRAHRAPAGAHARRPALVEVGERDGLEHHPVAGRPQAPGDVVLRRPGAGRAGRARPLARRARERPHVDAGVARPGRGRRRRRRGAARPAAGRRRRRAPPRPPAPRRGRGTRRRARGACARSMAGGHLLALRHARAFPRRPALHAPQPARGGPRRHAGASSPRRVSRRSRRPASTAARAPSSARRSTPPVSGRARPTCRSTGSRPRPRRPSRTCARWVRRRWWCRASRRRRTPRRPTRRPPASPPSPRPRSRPACASPTTTTTSSSPRSTTAAPVGPRVGARRRLAARAGRGLAARRRAATPWTCCASTPAAARSSTPRTSGPSGPSGPTSPSATACSTGRASSPPLREGGTEWLVVEFDTPTEDTLGDIGRSLDALRRVLADGVTPLGVGVIGCGTISAVYLRNGSRFDSFRYVACADVDPAAAERAAREHGLEACTPDELLARPDVDVVLCLTPPDWHAEVALQAIAAGKHVHTEKPLATSVDGRARGAGGRRGRRRARRRGARHVPRPGHGDAARRRWSGARSGEPAVADVHLLAGPPEAWHPSPAFLYADLAGPLLDLGPYGVTAAVALLGPVRRVCALATRPRSEGRIASGPSAGTAFPIAEPTRVGAIMEHATGVVSTLTTSYDAAGAARHGVVVYGSEGTLLGGDPEPLRRARPAAQPRAARRGAAAPARLDGQRARARARRSLPRRAGGHAAARERRARAARARGADGDARGGPGRGGGGDRLSVSRRASRAGPWRRPRPPCRASTACRAPAPARR